MDRLFFYPKLDLDLTHSPNPYIINLEKSLAPFFEIVNKDYNKGGVLEFYQYLDKTDCYLFNWIEDLPIYRYGKIQVLFFVIFIILAKTFKKKIIWILHNKYSHFSKKNYWTDFMYWIMVKYSNTIITHSQDGVDFITKRYKGHEKKVKYIIHPIEPLLTKDHFDLETFDLLIWGAIHPYKGIYEFLEFLNENQPNNNIKILIVGKCFDKNYYLKLAKFINYNIIHLNEFKSLDDIAKLAQTSKYVFFPYNSPSLLSSGSLMDSLRMGTRILGPNSGSFKDLSYLSNIETYKCFDDVPQILKANKISLHFNKLSEMNDFYKINSWSEFGPKFKKAYDLFHE